MYNSTGYIRIWEPYSETGVIFGCDGSSDGLNVAFRFADICAPHLQEELSASGPFELEMNCDRKVEGAYSVNFFYDGNGFALDILPRAATPQAEPNSHA